MPPKNERHKIRNSNRSENKKEITLDDYEKSLLEEISEELKKEFDQTKPHRDFYQDKQRRVLQLSMMHQHLREFQLNQ